MQERVRELENAYKKYLFKKFLKNLFYLVFIGLLIYFIFLIVQNHYKQKSISLEALNYKKELEQNIIKAKILQEKNKITRAKLIQENNHTISKMQIDSKVFSIAKLKNNFYKNPSYERALILAREYYRIKDYKKSIFWALKANDIDKKTEDSWLIFAKAQIALGNKNQAEKALNVYLDSYGFIELDKELEND
ncbi:CDC27 family protein [Campylobacter estrildidarum]|uniref:Transformation system protein n=1 Tax=Campylobacter estrildidarum TaxID=2510189 RepID=A0A4U7BS66_9BACT|nr:transformation system protein [Campylobacter estrildidarum]